MSNHDAADSLDALAQILEALRATRSRLEKRRLLVGYLQALPDAAVTANYLKYMPPMLLGIPNIYFAIIAAFVFVIIVFI